MVICCLLFVFYCCVIDCHFREATREMKCSDGAICMSSKIRSSTGDPSSLLPNVYIFLKTQSLQCAMCLDVLKGQHIES